MSSVTYPAISAYISTYADADKQGLVQGLITGVRSLCGGIGPAMFGLLFNIFDVDMYEEIKANPFSPHTAQDPLKPFIRPDLGLSSSVDSHHHHIGSVNSPVKHSLKTHPIDFTSSWIVGPPFLFGAILVILAAITATFIPDSIMPYKRYATKSSGPSYYRYTSVLSSTHENGISAVSNTGNGTVSSECELLQDTED